MRLFFAAVAAVCVSAPASARIVTLDPAASFGFSKCVDNPSYPEPWCETVSNPLLFRPANPTGTGSYGWAEVDFPIDDIRANFEFDLGGVGKFYRAKLRFTAIDTWGAWGAAHFVSAYSGNGVADIADFDPVMLTDVATFESEYFSEEPYELGHVGDFDISALVRQMIKDGEGFLGLQFVMDDHDTITILRGVRIDFEVPEPATLALLGLGLAGLAARRRISRA